jgi:DNA repair protein RadC
MADMNFATTRATPRNRVKARELVPCYRAGAGPASFRHGMPEHERSVVDAALAILGRYLGEPGASFASPDAVRDFLRLHLGAEKTEVFAVLYLDSQNRAIAFETPFNGTLAQTSVYPREIARAAIGHNAAAVVLAHNHPSGAARPSRADEALTQSLKSALALIDVRVLDHFIVTGKGCASMAEMGLV